MAKLKVFKTKYAIDLSSNVENNLSKYQNCDSEYFKGDGQGILTSSYDISDEPPQLVPDMKHDADNAIKVYEYLSIDNTIASDPRLWSYLAHVTFCEYSVKRWGIDENQNPDKIRERFFRSDNARSLRRHSIARLWWAVELTESPWEKDEELVKFKKEDKYFYTRVLMKDESFASDLTERPQISSSVRLLTAILEFDYLHNKSNKWGRSFYREFLKEIILTLGYKKLMSISIDDLLNEFNDIATDIEKKEWEQLATR